MKHALHVQLERTTGLAAGRIVVAAWCVDTGNFGIVAFEIARIYFDLALAASAA